MYPNLDYENITPVWILQFLKLKWDKERIKKILDLWLFKIVDWEFSILSYKCKTIKKIWHEEKQMSSWFPFNHQVFWFALQELQDLDFAISEVKRILEWERQYMFPNGNLVILEWK